MVPIVCVALILGCADELKGLSTLRSAVETFSSFCKGVTVETLRGLLSVHCEPELREIFNDVGSVGAYALGPGNDGVLQAVYSRLTKRT